jgi:LPS-assembly protein
MSRSEYSADRFPLRGTAKWGAAVAAVFVATAGISYAQEASPPPSDNAPAVVLEADQVISDDKAGVVIADGNVEAHYQGRTLKAEKLIYDLNRHTVRAEGRVEILDADGTVRFADEIETDDALNAGVATGFSTRIPGGGVASAASAVRRADGVNELNRVVYTACPVCSDGSPPSWSLRARKATQNPNNDTISYRDVTLQVHGVPVLWLPYFAHPDPSSDRKSGFLLPGIGQKKRTGWFYEQPYYWAISPYSELTVAPRFMANVNPLFSARYKKRFWSGEVIAQGSVTEERDFDNDGNKFGDDTWRSHLFASGNFRIDDYWKWGFGVARTSDDLYLRRYDISEASGQTGLFLNDLTRLFSHVDLTGQDANSYANLSFISAQGLRATDSDATLPLVLPVADYERVWRDPWLDGQLHFTGSTANLVRDGGVNSARVSSDLKWNLTHVLGPGVLFSPFAEARADFYRIENYTTPDDETLGRALGLAGAELRWPLLRLGEHVNWLVEPIAMAAIGSNGGNDPRIPNEDDQSFELDDSDLFRPDGAPNYDLWEPGPRMALGVRATAMTDSGEATVTVGRRWRDDQVTAFAPITNLRDDSSDWIAAVSADMGPALGGSIRLRLDDESLEVNRLDASVRTRMGRFAAVARYFNLDSGLSGADPSEEVSGTVGFDLTQQWNLSYGLRRDLDSDINLSQNARLTFRDDCTFLEFVYSRTETSDRSLGPSEGFQIRFGLSTLGVFGGSG